MVVSLKDLLLTFLFVFIFILILILVFNGVFMLIKKQKPDGSLFINESNPEKDLYQLLIYRPIEEIPNSKYLIFRVEKHNR